MVRRRTAWREQLMKHLRKVFAAALAVAAVTSIPGSTAGAAPRSRVTEFTVPSPGSRPYQIVAGPDGNLWFTESGAGTVGKITPDGHIAEYKIRKDSAPYGITVGPDGNIWFTEKDPAPDGTTRVGKLTTDGHLTEYFVSAFSQPWDIVAGPDGALWFTEEDANLIGRITTDGGLTEYATGTCCFPTQITVGFDGNLWFTEEQGPAVVRMTTDGITRVFPYGDPTALLYAARQGPDGNVWVSDIISTRLGKISPGGLHKVRVPGSSTGVAGLASGPDGNVWFTENDSAHIGATTPDGTTVHYIALAADRRPIGITAGPDGNIWFCEADAGMIGRLSLS